MNFYVPAECGCAGHMQEFGNVWRIWCNIDLMYEGEIFSNDIFILRSQLQLVQALSKGQVILLVHYFMEIMPVENILEDVP